MKDAEARARLASLTTLVNNMPQQVADIVIEHFSTKFDAVYLTLDSMREAAEGINALSQLVEGIGAATNENSELLEVLDAQFNTLCVDFNAIREAQAEQANTMLFIKETLRGVAGILGKAASS